MSLNSLVVLAPWTSGFSLGVVGVGFSLEVDCGLCRFCFLTARLY